ncbi:MAG: hypothetical protein EOM76_09705 [Sphingobacteriia bacterium]|nr:hypothetical protein [Sphingobacteriia bacterium]
MGNGLEKIFQNIEKARKTNTHTSTKNFCEICGNELANGYTICSSRCKLIREVRKNPERIANTIIPPKYAKAKLEDFPELIEKVKKIMAGEWEGFFICGDVGRGKTHLAGAITRDYIPMAIDSKGVCSVIWRLVPALLGEIKSGWADGKNNLDDYCNCMLLVLDDFGAEHSTDWSLTTLYTIIATRIDHCRKTIITSNLSLDRIAEVEPRIVSRRIASRISSPSFAKIKLDGDDRRAKR